MMLSRFKNHVKKFWRRYVLPLLAIPVVLAAPLEQYEMTWVKSYETDLFDTPSGYLEEGQYAVTPDGNIWIYDEILYSDGSVDKNSSRLLVPSDTDVTGLKEVTIIGKAYYHEFFDIDGNVVVEKITKTEYDDLAAKDAEPAKKTGSKSIVKAGSVHAAIAFDAATTNDANASSMTFAHTVSGSNRIIVVGVGIDNPAGNTVSSVTYNGTGLSELNSKEHAGGSSRAEMWYLAAPSTGSNNVVVTLDSSAKHGAAVASYTGVDQTTPWGTSATASANGSPITVDVSSASGELVVDFAASDLNRTLTVGSGQTERANFNWGVGGHTTGFSEEDGAATVTMSWSQNLDANWTQVAAPLKAASGGGPTDTCTPTKGTQWDMNLEDNCYTKSDIWHDQAIHCSGSGSWTIDGATVRVASTSTGCIPLIKNSGKFIIVK